MQQSFNVFEMLRCMVKTWGHFFKPRLFMVLKGNESPAQEKVVVVYQSIYTERAESEINVVRGMSTKKPSHFVESALRALSITAFS